MTLLQGFVMGSGIRNWVQLGTMSGYSMILGAFMMRHMSFNNALLGVDINPTFVDYTNMWLERCGLRKYAKVLCANYADRELPAAAEEYFGAPTRLVFIDSSHQYAHTLVELDLWSRAVVPGGFMLLHDTTPIAADFDTTKEGGVHRALAQWSAQHPEFRSINVSAGYIPNTVYADPCGVGIIQRPF
jgi:predicted O-methyltransferase YrrM